MWKETDQSEYEDDEGAVYVVIEETEFTPTGAGAWTEGMKRKFLASGVDLVPTDDPGILKVVGTQQFLRRRS